MQPRTLQLEARGCLVCHIWPQLSVLSTGNLNLCHFGALALLEWSLEPCLGIAYSELDDLQSSSFPHSYPHVKHLAERGKIGKTVGMSG